MKRLQTRWHSISIDGPTKTLVYVNVAMLGVVGLSTLFPATSGFLPHLTFAILTFLASNWVMVILQYKKVLDELQVSNALYRIASTDTLLSDSVCRMADSIARVRHLIIQQNAHHFRPLFESMIREHLATCQRSLSAIEHGSISCGSNVGSDLTMKCYDLVEDTVHATSFPDRPGPELVVQNDRERYLDSNRRALASGVEVTRYFILSDIFVKQGTFDRFVAELLHHLALQSEYSQNGVSKYSIGFVLLTDVRFANLGGDMIEIPDVSWYDETLLSRWLIRHPKLHPGTIDRSVLSIDEAGRHGMRNMFDELKRVAFGMSHNLNRVPTSEYDQRTVQSWLKNEIDKRTTGGS